MITNENFYKFYYVDTTPEKAIPTATRRRIENGQIIDVVIENKSFQEDFTSVIRILPFTSNPSTSNYDKSCGLSGVTGEFFRICKDRQNEAISDFEKNAVEPVRSYLKNERHMKDAQVDEFISVMRDVMYGDNILTIISPSFLKFIPIGDQSTHKKYKRGQIDLAEYLASILSTGEILKDMLSKKPNLFTSIISEALSRDFPIGNSRNKEFVILPFIKTMFNTDLKWLLIRDDSVVVKYIHIFLHFYLCFAISQTLIFLNYKRYKEEPAAPEKMYYILTSEHASESRDAVIDGWSKHVNKEATDKLFGRLEALDIINGVFGSSSVGLYNDVYKEFQKETFNGEAKILLEDLLVSFQRDRRAQLKSRETAKFEFPDLIDTSVNSFDEFIEKISKLCTILQSKEYEGKMRSRVNNIMKMRLLSTRRGREILNLDDEMLFFLMALATKGERMKVDNLYEALGRYGISFDNMTKGAVESYLLKLNLLERKSDSGEAQYVRIVL